MVLWIKISSKFHLRRPFRIQVYSVEAEELGLTAGHFWEKSKDSTHVQYHTQLTPKWIYPLDAIDKQVKFSFSL